ncbi:hypothetical protein PIROE2DRAFT_15672 [Piromyces sp. E2]|nr:hypothetical protein PIROE2DRAFT_15672 [Piromyces sp. E2]|eukprot:OUM58937.1 hypothetical protein PIROE2DRAFT_15672 [Piromyces sp. E2]
MITFVSYASVDPVVISEELINTAINEQVAPEIADIARREGIDPEEVTSIRLDYKNKDKYEKNNNINKNDSIMSHIQIKV